MMTGAIVYHMITFCAVGTKLFALMLLFSSSVSPQVGL
jgi:hypothetical protein